MKPFVFFEGKPLLDSTLIKDFSLKQISVFETFRIYDGRVFRLADHLDRLEESAKTVGFKIKQTRVQLKKEIQKAIGVFIQQTKKTEAVARLTFFESKPVIFMGQRRVPRALYQKGIRLQTSPVVRSHTNAASSQVKSNAYQNGVLAHLEPKEDQIYEWVYLSEDGFVQEVSVGNLFIVKANRLLTPDTPGILNGVTRQSVIECALQAGIKVEETNLTRHEIYNADEAFLTNTSWEILPIQELDCRKIGSQIPGPLTQQLQQLFKETVSYESHSSRPY